MKQLHQMTGSRSLLELLVSPGYCTIQVREQVGELVPAIIKDFMRLLDEPEEIRKKWFVDADGNGDPDDGLVERNGGSYDHKFFFHYKHRNRLIPKLKENGADAKGYRLFLENLQSLHYVLTNEMMNVVHTLDNLEKDYRLFKRVKSQPETERGVVRLLYYKPGYKTVAQPHLDQSLFTFHVADSTPGLIVGKENEKIGSVYVPKRDTLLLFPGIKAEIATDDQSRAKGDKIVFGGDRKSHRLISAGYHAAKASDEALAEGRWAIVYFFHCPVDMTPKELSAFKAKRFAEICSS